MLRQAHQSLVPPRPGAARTERPPVSASGSDTNENKESRLVPSGNAVKSNALSYRAVAARAVGGCRNCSMAVPSAHDVVLPQPAAGTSGTDSRAAASSLRTTGSATLLNAASPLLGDGCSHSKAAAAASGTHVRGAACANLSNSAPPAPTTTDASTPRQIPSGKKLSLRNSGQPRQERVSPPDRRCVNNQLSSSRLADAHDLVRRPGSPAASYCSPVPVAATQEKGRAKAEKSATNTAEASTAKTEVDLPTRHRDDNDTATLAATIPLSRARQGASVCRKKKRQQQQRHQSSTRGPHKQQLCREQQLQQHGSTQQHHVQHGQQLLARERPHSQEFPVLQKQKEQLSGRRQHTQQELKQELPRPTVTNLGHNHHHENSTARRLSSVHSSDSAYSDTGGKTDDDCPASTAETDYFSNNGHGRSRELSKGCGTSRNTRSASRNVSESAHGTRSNDWNNWGPRGSGAAPQPASGAASYQRQRDGPGSRSSTTLGHTASSSSMSAGSSICRGNNIGYYCSISTKCSTSSTSACASSDDSNCGTRGSNRFTKPHASCSSNPKVGTNEPAISPDFDRCNNSHTTALAAHYVQQASSTAEASLSASADSKGSSKEPSRRASSSTDTPRRTAAAMDMVQSSTRGSHSKRKPHEIFYNRVGPLFEKQVNVKDGGGALQRRASVSGLARPYAKSSSSSRCSSVYQVTGGVGITADPPSDGDTTARATNISTGSAAARPAACAAVPVAQCVLGASMGTAAACLSKTGVAPAPTPKVVGLAVSNTGADSPASPHGECIWRRNTARSRRGRSTPCARPLLRRNTHKATAEDTNASHNSAVSQAISRNEPCPAGGDRAVLENGSLPAASFCLLVSASAASTASVSQATSAKETLIGTYATADIPVRRGEGYVQSVPHQSEESASSPRVGTSAAAYVKRAACNRKSKVTYRSRKADNFQRSEVGQPTASAVATSRESPTAGTLTNSMKPRAGRLAQPSTSSPSTALVAKSETTKNQEQNAAGASSTVGVVAPSSVADGVAASAVPSAVRSRPEGNIQSRARAEICTEKEASSAVPSRPPAHVASSGLRRGATGRWITAEKHVTVDEPFPAVSASLSSSEISSVVSDNCGAAKPSQHFHGIPRKLSTCAESASTCSAVSSGASCVASKRTTVSSGTVDGPMVDVSVPVKANTKPQASAGASPEWAPEPEGGPADTLIAKEVQDSQSSKLATSGGERISVLLPDGSLNLEIFKVFPCRNRNAQHEKKSCPYYHNSRDRRRAPVTYRAEQCEEHFDLDTASIQCSKGEDCDKSHNRHELLYHPHIYKQRFCSNLPCVLPFKGPDDERGAHPNLRKGMPCCTTTTRAWGCVRGVFCAFAHSREEIRASLFTEEEEKNPDSHFFVNKFKTIWCPYGSQHDWRTCVYAHTYQDCRRSPLIGYGSEPCAAWNKDLHSADYEKRCPHGARCSYSHGSKEQLYHPSYYKTMPCIDYKPATAGGPNNRAHIITQQTSRRGTDASSAAASALAAAGGCPRGFLCAFYHEGRERRLPTPLCPQFTYAAPLPISQLKLLQPLFLKPPLFNLDDFEAFGHTSRQAAALRRNQAASSGQRTGDVVTSASGSHGTRTMGTAPDGEIPLGPRHSAAAQYRSIYSHKSGTADCFLRSRETGVLTTPHHTKWLSNSNPLDHRPAEGLKASCYPSVVGSVSTRPSAHLPAATARARSVGGEPPAAERRYSAAGTCDGGRSTASRTDIFAIPPRDALMPRVEIQQHPAGKDDEVATGGVVPFTHRRTDAGVCSGTFVKYEEAASAEEETGVASQPPGICYGDQGSLCPRDVGAPAHCQPHGKIQYKPHPLGNKEREQEVPNKHQDLRSLAQHHSDRDPHSQSETALPLQQGQHAQQQHGGNHMQETLADFMTNMYDLTEHHHRESRNSNVFDREAVRPRREPERGMPLELMHKLHGAETFAVSRASRVTNKGAQEVSGVTIGEQLPERATVSTSPEKGAGMISAPEVTGCAGTSAIGSVTEAVGIASTVICAERTVIDEEHKRVSPPVGTVLRHDEVSQRDPNSNTLTRLIHKTLHRIGDLERQTTSIHLSAPDYFNMPQRFEPFLGPQACVGQKTVKKQQVQTKASTVEPRPTDEQLQPALQQAPGQRLQGLLPGHEYLVAALSSMNNQDAKSSHLFAWQTQLANAPAGATEVRTYPSTAGGIHELTSAEPTSASDNSASGTSVPSAEAPACRGALLTSRVGEQHVPVQTVPISKSWGTLEGAAGVGKEGTDGVRENSCSVNKCSEGPTPGISETIEDCEVAQSVFSPRSPTRLSEAEARQRSSSAFLESQRDQVVVLHRQQHDNAVNSIFTGESDCVRATWLEIDGTFKRQSIQAQSPRNERQKTGEQKKCTAHHVTLYSMGSPSSLAEHPVSKGATSNPGCHSSNSESTSSSTCNHSSCNSNINLSDSDPSSIDCGSHADSRIAENSRAVCTAKRKFIGLFNNGQVWQMPPYGYSREDSGLFWGTGGSSGSAPPYSTREWRQSNLPSSVTSHACATTGSKPHTVETEAGGRCYSHWSLLSGGTGECVFSASSPPCTATGQSSYAAVAGIWGELSRDSSIRGCHRSQLTLSTPQSSLPQLTETGQTNARALHTPQGQCTEAATFSAEVQAAPATFMANAATAGNEPLMASITETRLFAAESSFRAALPCTRELNWLHEGACKEQTAEPTPPGDVDFLQSVGVPKRTLLPGDVEGRWAPCNVKSGDKSSIDVANPNNSCNSCGSFYGADHNQRTTDEHCYRDVDVYGTRTINYTSGNRTGGSSMVSPHRTPSFCKDYTHNIFNSIPLLFEEKQQQWGDALCSAGDCVAADELAEGVARKELFAASAPPILYSSPSGSMQEQELRHHEDRGKDLLQEQDECKQEYRGSLLLCSYFPTMPHERQAGHVSCCLPQEKMRHQGSMEQLNFRQSPSTVLFHTRHSQEVCFAADMWTPAQQYNPEARAYVGGCRSAEGGLPLVGENPTYDGICVHKYDGTSTSSAQSHSEAAAAAASTVLSLLDEDERPDPLQQEERISVCMKRIAGKAGDHCPSLLTLLKRPNSEIGSAPLEAATDSKGATVRGLLSPIGCSIRLPASAPPATEALSRSAPLGSVAPSFSSSAANGIHFVDECFPVLHRATTIVQPGPAEATQQHPGTCHTNNRACSMGNDEGAEATVAEGACKRQVCVSFDLGRSPVHTAVTSVDCPADSAGRFVGVPATGARSGIAVGGPLVVGTATSMQQQQLLLLLLRSQLWEKILIAWHLPPGSSTGDTHSPVDSSGMHSVHTTHMAGLAEISENGHDAVGRKYGGALVDATVDETAGRTAQQGKQPSQVGDPPAVLGPARQAPSSTDEPFEAKDERVREAGFSVGAPKNTKETVTEEYPAIEDEAATIVKAAQKEDYICNLDFLNTKPRKNDVLLALEAAGFESGLEQKYRQGRTSKASNGNNGEGEAQQEALQTLRFVNGQRLLVLTHTPRQRGQRPLHTKEIETDEEPRQDEKQPLPAAQHGNAGAHIKAPKETDTGSQKRKSSTARVAPSFLSGLSPHAVIYLHRSPLELSKWLCEVRQQGHQGEDGSNSASSSTSAHSNDSSSGNFFSNDASYSTGSTCQASTAVDSSEGDLGAAPQRQAKAVLTNAKDRPQVRLPTETDSPVCTANDVGSPLDICKYLSPHESTAPVDRVKDRVPCFTVDSTPPLLRVVALHIVSDCESSLDLLSHLSPHHQERCFFPQAHELPLWFSFLHYGSRGYNHRIGGGSHLSPTNRTRIYGSCASSTPRNGSLNSTASKTFTGGLPLVATPLFSPTTVPSLAPVSASMEAPSAAGTMLRRSTSAEDELSSGAQVARCRTRGSTKLPGLNISRCPQRPNSAEKCRTQSCCGKDVDSRVLHKERTAAESPRVCVSSSEGATAAGTTRVPVTRCQTDLVGYAPVTNHVKTDKLEGSAEAVPPSPANRAETSNQFNIRSSTMLTNKEDASDLALPLDHQEWLPSEEQAFTGFKSALLSPRVSLKFSTRNNGCKRHHDGCCCPNNCNGDRASQKEIDSVFLSSRDSDTYTNFLQALCKCDSLAYEACGVDFLGRQANFLEGVAEQSRIWQGLSLFEELREAKRAVMISQQQQSTEVLLCVCWCGGRGTPASSKPFQLSLPRAVDHSAAVVLCAETAPAGRSEEGVAAREGLNKLIQPDEPPGQVLS